MQCLFNKIDNEKMFNFDWKRLYHAVLCCVYCVLSINLSLSFSLPLTQSLVLSLSTVSSRQGVFADKETSLFTIAQLSVFMVLNHPSLHCSVSLWRLKYKPEDRTSLGSDLCAGFVCCFGEPFSLLHTCKWPLKWLGRTVGVFGCTFKA